MIPLPHIIPFKQLDIYYSGTTTLSHDRIHT
jgi:hypothetical protein